MKCPSYAFVFIEYDNRLFLRWRHFTLYQNPLRPGLHKRSTDLAKSKPDGGVLLCELGSVQVVYHSCERHEMSIVFLHVLKERNWPTNRL